MGENHKIGNDNVLSDSKGNRVGKVDPDGEVRDGWRPKGQIDSDGKYTDEFGRDQGWAPRASGSGSGGGGSGGLAAVLVIAVGAALVGAVVLLVKIIASPKGRMVLAAVILGAAVLTAAYFAVKEIENADSLNQVNQVRLSDLADDQTVARFTITNQSASAQCITGGVDAVNEAGFQDSGSLRRWWPNNIDYWDNSCIQVNSGETLYFNSSKTSYYDAVYKITINRIGLTTSGGDYVLLYSK